MVSVFEDAADKQCAGSRNPPATEQSFVERLNLTILKGEVVVIVASIRVQLGQHTCKFQRPDVACP